MAKQSKKKGNTMSLTDFLNDTATGSWAEDTSELPSAPAASLPTRPGDTGRGFGSTYQRPTAGSGGSYASNLSSYTRLAPAEPRDLPTSPPYTAYVGNLPFDITEDYLGEFFAPCQITHIRMVRDRMTDRPKGFCYVEFDNVESLVKALELHGEEGFNQNRSGHGFDEDRSEGVSNWRREGPLTSRVPYEENSPAAGSSNWRAHDAPAPQSSFRDRAGPGGAGPYPRHGGNRFGDRPMAPSISDEAGNWRENRVTPPSFQSTAPSRAPSSGSTWGPSSSSPSRGGEPHGASNASAAPITRKRLQLAPRSANETSSSSPAGPASTRPKSNPFGNAKPRDELEMQRRVEERRRERANSNASKTSAADDAASATSANPTQA
ncbi:Eukaryotic translation initiation factor 4B [Dimargaris cristalligena]|nr:Eukaryotic translation initiation factor 4B [Dimargaris cristalligena]